jgi:flagellum-specific peptidoglycan hydrolase FlgJ
MAKMEPSEFFQKLAPVVIPIAKKYGLPPSIALAQAAIESGWGEYTIGQHNYFGRKWGGWGKYIELPTEEEIDGKRITIKDKFQDYDSLDQAIEDYYVLLTQDPKYVSE